MEFTTWNHVSSGLTCVCPWARHLTPNYLTQLPMQVLNPNPDEVSSGTLIKTMCQNLGRHWFSVLESKSESMSPSQVHVKLELIFPKCQNENMLELSVSRGWTEAQVQVKEDIFKVSFCQVCLKSMCHKEKLQFGFRKVRVWRTGRLNIIRVMIWNSITEDESKLYLCVFSSHSTS